MQLRSALERAIGALPSDIGHAARGFIGDISRVQYVFVEGTQIEADKDKLTLVVSDLVRDDLEYWSLEDNILNRKFNHPALIAEADRESEPYAKDWLKPVPSKYREYFKEELARAALGFVGLHAALRFPRSLTHAIEQPRFAEATSRFKKQIIGSMIRQLPK